MPLATPARENDADSSPDASPAPSAPDPGAGSRTPADSAGTRLRCGVEPRPPAVASTYLLNTALPVSTSPERRHSTAALSNSSRNTGSRSMRARIDSLKFRVRGMVFKSSRASAPCRISHVGSPRLRRHKEGVEVNSARRDSACLATFWHRVGSRWIQDHGLANC